MDEAFAAYYAQVMNLWHTGHGLEIDGLSRVPLINHLPGRPITELKVLLVGLNPSFAPKNMQQHWDEVHGAHAQWGRLTVTEALAWPPRDDLPWAELEIAIEMLDLHSRKNWPRFFEPIKTFAREAGLQASQWLQMDVFPIRTTQQRALTSMLDFPKTSELQGAVALKPDAVQHARFRWNPLFVDLLGAFRQLLVQLQPPVVVVLNSWASQMLKYELDLTLMPNGHRYKAADMPNTGWLLASQLSGGATSIPSAERLLADLRDLLRGGCGLDGGALQAA